uniref:COP9 signalosome complex subunit 6 n=1 Tax=Aceria tosichella TaxID=561515 RepID=A0A6G1SCN0_9ACAR
MLLHPSVIMSISEHHSRTKALRTQLDVVVGALLGKKRDHQIEIVDSFELRIVPINASNTNTTTITTTPTNNNSTEENKRNLIVDREFVQKRIPLVKQVFPELDLIGWYSTTPQIDGNSEDGNFVVSLHKQISEFIANPIYVKLNPNSRESDPKISGSLPLKIYEPVIEISGSDENLNLIEAGWTIVTDDVEIIGLEHNAKVTHIDRAPSAAVDYLKLQYGAVKMLKDRIKVISKFVKDVQSGTLPYYEEPMADIMRLTQRFPLMNSDAYTRAYNMQCNDVALNTYLGILTKGSMCKMNFDKPNSKMRALSTTRARH